MSTEPGQSRLNKLDDLAKQILSVLPAGTEQLRADLHRNVRAVMTSALARMDLVTRDEFDVQVELLARTRKKLDKLEQVIETIERQADGTTKHRTTED